MRVHYLLCFVVFLVFAGCTVPEKTTPAKSENTQREKVTISNSTPETVRNTDSKPTNQNDKKTESSEWAGCENLKKEGFAVDSKQTFPVNFSPFEKSCFVTFHDPEFTNPPLGSQYFIYKNGKEIYAFPDQFNSGNTSCWIASVAFEDVNDDELTDVMIIGKCGAKSGAYNENMVYLNTGKDFVTNVEANVELLDYTRISQVRDFVRKNQPMFSK